MNPDFVSPLEQPAAFEVSKGSLLRKAIPSASGASKPFLIAGPCSAETPAQFDLTLNGLVPLGPDLIRAGIWKPRTRPNRFEGVGVEGLRWVREMTRERNLLLAVEVAQPAQAEAALKFEVDVVWIGARTTVNPFLVDELGKVLASSPLPVMIKNPINPDLELWLGAVERLEVLGLHDLALVHRGFSPFEPSPYRNMPQWEIPIELRRRRPDLPMYCDPSHITGDARLVPEFAQIALDLCYDGWMFEVHHNPSHAWSDPDQQLTPDQLVRTLNGLKLRKNDLHDPSELSGLSELRQEVDHLDHELLDLLSRRLQLSHRLGEIKKDFDLPILQPRRWEQILNTRTSAGHSMGLDSSFLFKWLQLMHQESIRRQLEVYRSDSAKTP